MEVLGLCSFPVEAACTRYRFTQYVAPLADRGINLTVSPFYDSKDYVILYKPGRIFHKAVRTVNLAAKHLLESLGARRFDAVFVQREAALVGPPVFEWLYKKIENCPLILDLDDATYIRYVSPTYGRLASALKFFGKTDTLIDWSETVICGNRFIADYVADKGKNTIIVPTVVDTDKFCPVERDAKKPLTVGWIGSHATFLSLEVFFPVLCDLARKYDFTLKIVGSFKDKIEIEGIRVENLTWKLERETEDFQSLDIGLYPLEENEFIGKDYLQGKSGFKAIQYMSVGIPFVLTPVGICAEIGIENKTHFAATTKEQWYDALAKLLESAELRKKMGENGRNFALEHYSLPQQADKIADTLHKAVKSFRQKTGNGSLRKEESFIKT